MNIKRSNKKIKCLGPCPYEPLELNPDSNGNPTGGTLKDGTTYTFTATSNGANAVFIDQGNGAIEFGSSSDETLTVTFSAPVDMQFTNSAAAGTRIVWHGNGTRGTRANTNGSSWCYTEGTVNANINVVGQQADTLNESGVNMASDWGVLETFGTTVVDLTSYVFDAYNFEARPLGDKVEQPICDVVEALCKKVAVGTGGGGGSETLTSLTADATGDNLTYTDENGTANLIPLAHTELDICTGPFVDCNNRSGWIGPAGVVHTANSGNVDYIPWTVVGGSGAIVSPNCDTDLIVNIDFGHVYYYLRRMRMYYWVDVRLLINGTPVVTQTTDQYHYDDERDATPLTGNAALLLKLEEIGNSEIHRLNVPPNSVITVEEQVRYNFNAAQTQAYGRIIRQGLRSRVTATFTPKTIVIGEVQV